MESIMKRSTQIAAAFLLAAALASASGSEEEGLFDTYGVETIVVRSGALDVRVSGGDNPEATFDSDWSTDRIVQRRDGPRLSVWVEHGGLFPSPESGQIRIRAPRGTDVRVESGAGRVFVDGIEGGTYSVHTVSGRIRVDHVRGRLSVDSVSGGIDMDSMEGSVNAKTVSGGIAGRNVCLDGDSSFSSVSGNVDVELDSSIEDFAFDLKSVSGSITVGEIRAERGLRMGFGRPLVRGHTISGALSFH
jgi:hypothetical protein